MRRGTARGLQGAAPSYLKVVVWKIAPLA